MLMKLVLTGIILTVFYTRDYSVNAGIVRARLNTNQVIVGG